MPSVQGCELIPDYPVAQKDLQSTWDSGYLIYWQRPSVWLTWVHSVARVLNKSGDKYLALLNYRDTPLHHGYSPAQVSMGRKLHTRVPCHLNELKPETPDYDHIRRKEREYRAKLKFNYDHRHRVVEREELSPGYRISILDLKAEGTVIKQRKSPRSVVIQTSNGQVKRNQTIARRVLEGRPPLSQ